MLWEKSVESCQFELKPILDSGVQIILKIFIIYLILILQD